MVCDPESSEALQFLKSLSTDLLITGTNMGPADTVRGSW